MASSINMTSPNNEALFDNTRSNAIVPRVLPEKKELRIKEFPAEIRNMIWGMTIKQRLVEIRFTRNEGIQNCNTHDFIADIPAILHLCHESRDFALKYYELAFFHPGAVAPVYFNFELDILYPRASATKEQLEFLRDNMNSHDTSRVRHLAMYNEHLERTQSLSTWNAFPHAFPHIEKLMVLFKSFVNPKTIDAEAVPACKDSMVREPSRVDRVDTMTGRKSPAWIKYDREILKENLRAYLQPPWHSCQRKTQKGQSRRTHLVSGNFMRKDWRHTYHWAIDKALSYRAKLKKVAKGIVNEDGGRFIWRNPRLEVWGLCEHGLEFEEAPGLAYKGKFFRRFDDQGNKIK
ncbi:hypothetical protein OCU04_002776 [Sclerotinia nivalis]|uniref:2EXR domain-containing protein n=1 Tax=Sclerotinia nivalis TaxID=352851 RepID=A0A9X0AXQ5_9HELO|nr:hypothetical protein OCU04_002776 [Sclerotinia nivalis]